MKWGWAAALAACVLAGCAAPGGQRVAGEKVVIDQKIVPGEGYVLLKIQSARPANVLNPKWKTVWVQPRESGVNVDLLDLSDVRSPGSLFYARLPAGTYAIKDVHSDAPFPGLINALAFSAREDLAARALSFTVEPGAVANLGTIVVAPPLDKDPKTLKVELLRDALGRAAAREALERRAGVPLTLREVAGWAGSEDPAQSARALARARASVSVLSPGHDEGEAILVGGTVLGQILFREREGWRAETLDSLAPVTYVRRMRDGTLVAGSEAGRYFVRRPGRKWTAHELALPDGNVVHVEPLGQRGALLVASTLGQTVVYHMADLGAPAKPVATLDTAFPFRGWVISTRDALIFPKNSSTIAREVELIALDKRDFELSSRSEKFQVWTHQRLASGELLMQRLSGTTTYLSVSRDEGRTWEHRSTAIPTWAHFLDLERGYAIDFSRGAFSVDSYLAKTVDGGRTWTRTGVSTNAETAGEVLGVGPKGEVIARLGWEVYATADEGKTWRRELPRPLD